MGSPWPGLSVPPRADMGKVAGQDLMALTSPAMHAHWLRPYFGEPVKATNKTTSLTF